MPQITSGLNGFKKYAFSFKFQSIVQNADYLKYSVSDIKVLQVCIPLAAP